MCDCIDTVDKLLAEYNTRLTQAFCFSPPHTRLMIETEIIEKKRGAKPKGMFPTFCPFCGEAYPRADETVSKIEEKEQ